MKKALCMTSLFLLTWLCVISIATPAFAGDLYDNGLVNGENAWTISRDFIPNGYNYYVSNSFVLQPGHNYNVTGFDFVAWLFPGDVLDKVSWEISTSPFNGSLGLGTACLVDGPGCNGTLINHDVGVNAYGYILDQVQVSGINLGSELGPGTYYLTLESAHTNTGDPVYWDENSGVSQAFQNSLGTVPSETFTIEGTTDGSGTVPEPSSLVMMGSGVIALAGLIRKRTLR